jgi:hypothetical protein
MLITLLRPVEGLQLICYNKLAVICATQSNLYLSEQGLLLAQGQSPCGGA